MCIDIVEIWFGIANGQITELSAHYTSMFLFPDDNFSQYINQFSPNLVCALILWSSGLGLLIGKFRQFLTVICLPHNSGGIL